MQLKLERESLVQAVNSFCAPFTWGGHPFSFTVELLNLIASELPEDCGDEEIEFVMPVATDEAVIAIVKEALDRDGYVAIVAADQCDGEPENWNVTIDAHMKAEK